MHVHDDARGWLEHVVQPSVETSHAHLHFLSNRAISGRMNAVGSS